MAELTSFLAFSIILDATVEFYFVKKAHQSYCFGVFEI